MLRLGPVSGGRRIFHAPRQDGVLLELSDVVVSYSRGALALRQHEALPAVGGVSMSVKVASPWAWWASRAAARRAWGAAS